MPDKTLILTDSLTSGQTKINETDAIGLNKKWMIHSFGAADQNLGDSKSTVYILKFGTDILRIICLTGATQEIPIKKELTGDGAKKMSVTRINRSGYTKECPCWCVIGEMG